MTTHELAKALTLLARVLKDLPEVDIRDLRPLVNDLMESGHESAGVDPDVAALNVSTLAALSRLNKSQWRALVEEWGLPLEIPTAYSARDTIGAVLRFLDKNPNFMSKLRKQSEAKASPELMKALAVIMGGGSR